MTFWNDSYQIEIDSINKFLRDEFIDVDSIQKNLDFIPDEQLVDSIIVLAWRYFEKIFINRRDLLNKNTKFNQSSLAERLKPQLDNLKHNRYIFLHNLLRLIYEYFFWSQTLSGIPFISTQIFERLDRVTPQDEYYAQFLWIERSMPAALTMFIMTSPNFETMKKMANDVDGYEEKFRAQVDAGTKEAIDLIINLNNKTALSIKDAKDAQLDLDKYNNKLTGYKNDFNFVLLSRAFNQLKDRKSTELTSARKTTWFFTALLAIPPAFSFFNHIFSWVAIGNGLSSLSYYLPLFTMEILIFYFMRLYYGEVRALNTQLLQIDHRLSLCEFIHDYIEKKNTDTENKDSWGMFETLIFSPIQLTADNIPSVLDGANAVADLAGKVMAKSKP